MFSITPRVLIVLRVHCSTRRRNEEIDDKSTIKRLKKRISELEIQLSLHRSDEVSFTADISYL